MNADVIALGGCVILKDNKLLLLLRKDSQHLEFPGGKVENEETPQQAAVREAKEELGVNVQSVHYLGYTDFTHAGKELRSFKVLCEITNGIPKIIESEVFEKLEWIALADWKKYVLAPNVQQFCEQWASGEFIALLAAPKGITNLVDKRPWGVFEQFVPGVAGTPCAVKILTIEPHQSLSKQYHHNRDEMWHVLSGTGCAEVGTEKFDLKSEDKVFIKRGQIHRLFTQHEKLQILELAFGRFDELDIVRLQDVYGRK